MTDVRARTSQSARNGSRYLLCGLGLLLALLTASCGNTIFVPGTPIFTITDRSGEFTSFIVTIDDIELTRNDGTIITLPMTNQRVDLVELSNVIDIMGAPAVEDGTYVSMTLIIDYTSPLITVDVNGHSVAAAVFDPTTNPVSAATTQTFTIMFDPSNPLVITNQKSTLVNIDVDLAAGTTIDFTTATPTVYVKSFATVNAAPVYNKPIRARGLFVIADTKNNNFIMNVRPFHDVSNSPFGAMTILPNDQTYYNINGVSYTGAAGLAALAAIQNAYSDFQVAVYGNGPGQGSPFSDLSTITPSFVPTAVYAGTSLESTIQDHIIGVVNSISNSGNTLNVGAAEFIWRYGGNSVYGSGISLVDTVPVNISSATAVSQDGVIPATSLTTSSVSVGQVIDVSGQATLDANGNPTLLDATAGPYTANGGQIRLQSTAAWGTAVSTTPTGTCNGMTLNLQLLGNFQPSTFTFIGTETGGGGATAATYCVNTGSLDLSSVTAASANSAQPLVRVDGLVAPFGSAPPNFNATAVTLGSSTNQSQLIIEWTGGGTTTPFTTLAPTGLVPNLALQNVNGIHEIRTGPNSLDITTLPAGFTITPAAIGTNSLLLSVGNLANTVQSFNSAQPWVSAISAALGKSIAVSKLVATGNYDPTANTFTAYDININE